MSRYFTTLLWQNSRLFSSGRQDYYRIRHSVYWICCATKKLLKNNDHVWLLDGFLTTSTSQWGSFKPVENADYFIYRKFTSFEVSILLFFFLLGVFRLVFTVSSNNKRPNLPLSRQNWRTPKGLYSLQFITLSPHSSVKFKENVVICTWFLRCILMLGFELMFFFRWICRTRLEQGIEQMKSKLQEAK